MSLNIFSKIKQFSNNSTIRNGAIFAFFAALNNGLNFVIILLLSLYLSKIDFGIINLFNVYTLIISVSITLGTQSYFGVVFFKKPKEEVKKLLTGIYIISLFALLSFFTIIMFFSQQLERLLLFKLNYQLLGLFYCFFQIFYNLTLEFYRLEERALKYGILSAIWIVSNLLFTILFCVIWDFGWEGRAFVQLLISIPFFLYSLSLLHRRAYIYFGIPSRSYFKELINFGVPLIPHNSTVWMRQGLDRYFINFYYGAAVVGSYSLAYNFAGLIMMLGTSFNASNSVFIYKALREYNDETKSKIIRLTVFSAIFFLIVTLFSIVGIYLFINFLAPKYTDAIPFIIPLCLMGFFQCLYYLFVNYLFYYNKTKGLMMITFGVSLIHVLLAFFLVKYSSLFLAYIGLFSTFLICVLVMIYSHKTYPLLKTHSPNLKTY